MTNEQNVYVLKRHRANLVAATTFEEYQAAHVKYVDYLLEIEQLDSDFYEVWKNIVQKTVGFAVLPASETKIATKGLPE